MFSAFAATPVTPSQSANSSAAAASPEKTTPANSENTPASITQKPNLGYFHSINLGGIGDLHIKQGNQMEFTIEASPTMFPLINAYVKDQVLYIDVKDVSKHEAEKINYNLTIKNLDEITSYSASTIYITDHFDTKSLKVSLLSGFGQAIMDLDVTSFIAKINGAGKMIISGVADEQDITITGVGEFDGSKLQSKIVNINMSSSGIAKVNVSDALQVKLPGNGQVKYCGNPKITKDISDKAIVEPLEETECH